jgi:hypothetical protein
MAIKIRSTPSIGFELKPEAPCLTILQHVKQPCAAWLRCYVNKIQEHLLSPPWVTGGWITGIISQMGRTIGQKMAAVLGTLRSKPPRNSNQQFSWQHWNPDACNNFHCRLLIDNTVARVAWLIRWCNTPKYKQQSVIHFWLLQSMKASDIYGSYSHCGDNCMRQMKD